MMRALFLTLWLSLCASAAPAQNPVDSIANTAVQLREQATGTGGQKLDIPGAVTPPANVAAPSAPAAQTAQAVSPADAPKAAEQAPSPFTEGQDHSIGVATEGKPDSIFFTPNQLAAIMRAKEGFLAPREAIDPANQGQPETVGPRVISLAGIVYVNARNWVVWINGERVTRKNIPQRLIGLTVRPHVAHLRWMDIPNQRIVNITLKPHQQYLLDSDTIIPANPMYNELAKQQ